eukprot:TRINITY_DN3846_c0_g1_i1.p1 TRINITY_DN3846_c0_g1~~TRINITY_DN3846_c0_g1_i1.p1  ORF type:complete len:735 (-),score=231.71 TRINITY_DN3846_c0_g1_i1:157-2361(-)
MQRYSRIACRIFTGVTASKRAAKGFNLLRASTNINQARSFSFNQRFFSETSKSGQQASSATEEKNFKRHDEQSMEFKAETKKLLDIVARSLYTDKDVFLRELLSNASDALEKQRYLQSTGKDTAVGEPLHINIILNEAKKQIIIQDTGIGMTKEELIENLGTIARSGSRRFIENLNKEGGNVDSRNVADSIIGQFGVGFYSSFIVGDTIEVYSRSGNEPGHVWVSDGSGKFSIATVDNLDFSRGTRIVIHLRPDSLNFCKREEVQKVIQRYSNFINYPIHLNGEKINLIGAVWTRDRKEVTDEEYKAFWEYISNSKVPYKYKIHYTADVPLQIKALLFIPSTHAEKFGMMQEESEVSLYSRKVLIKRNAKELMPHYLRFVKGVVDCEDIPLNISRESYQDSALIARLKAVISKRVLRLLEEEASRNEESYLAWYADFHMFLKEGLASEQENSDTLLGLMRYPTNFSEKPVPLEDYVKRMKQGQDKIYYLLAPTREAAEASPFLEPFRNSSIPILYVNLHVDEMVFRGVEKYKNFKFINIETSYEEISKDIAAVEHDQNKGLPQDEVTPFCLWVKNELQPVVGKVAVSKRLTDSPAIIVSELTSGMRQILSIMEKSGGIDANKNLTFEINPNHPIITKLNQARKRDLKLASMVLKQLLDNTLITSGLAMDTRAYVKRISKLMEMTLEHTIKESKEQIIPESHKIEQSQAAPKSQFTDDILDKEAGNNTSQNPKSN